VRVYGSQTQVAAALRARVAAECKGSLCVRRNGLSIKQREFSVITGFGPDHNLGVYNNSVDTIERALVERYFLCKDGEGFRPAFAVGPSSYSTPGLSEFRARVVAKMPNLPVLTSQQVVDSYHGPKRRLYQQALHSLEQTPLSDIDALVSMFVKFEKQDVEKAPRGINPRSTRFNLRLGKYLKHAEHHYFRAINKAFGARTRATVIKGFNADDAATILRHKWDRFARPIAIGLDASKFDMHVSVPALRYEHSFYEALFPGSRELRWLLRKQLRNRGLARAVDGTVKFSMEGTRCSGDLNTSLGNCIIMCALVWEYARVSGVELELANNGDDCVVFLDQRQEDQFRIGLSSWFQGKGFAMTVEDTVDEFERVEFCQTRPVQLSTGWRMVRKLDACIMKDPICLLSVPNDTVFRKWLGAVGVCGGKLSSGVPVLESFYAAFVRHGLECSAGMIEEVYKNRSQLRLANGVSKAVVDARSRVSFYYAFGVTPDQQLEMERFFYQVVILKLGDERVDRQWLVNSPGVNIVTESS